MVFRTLGPAAVWPGSSHHRNAGWQGLLLVKGPGRPVVIICLCSLGLRWWCGWLSSLRWVVLLGRPVIPTFDGWRLRVHRQAHRSQWSCPSLASLLPSLPPCVSARLPSPAPATLLATNLCPHHTGVTACKVWSPRSNDISGFGSGCPFFFCNGSTPGTSAAVPWKKICHVIPPSCNRDGWSQKCPLPRPTRPLGQWVSDIRLYTS